ncbi:MAG: hypothetical protein AB1611_07615 [bacterium]
MSEESKPKLQDIKDFIPAVKQIPRERYEFFVRGLPPLTRAGVNLFILVFIVTVGFIVFAIIGYGLKEREMTNTLKTYQSLILKGNLNESSY